MCSCPHRSDRRPRPRCPAESAANNPTAPSARRTWPRLRSSPPRRPHPPNRARSSPPGLVRTAPAADDASVAVERSCASGDRRVLGAGEQREDVVLVETRVPGPVHPRPELPEQPVPTLGGGGAQTLADKGAGARSGRDQTFALQLPVRLQDRVGVDRQRTDNLLRRRQPVAGPQQAHPNTVLDLLNQLYIRRYARLRVKNEDKHRHTI